MSAGYIKLEWIVNTLDLTCNDMNKLNVIRRNVSCTSKTKNERHKYSMSEI